MDSPHKDSEPDVCVCLKQKATSTAESHLKSQIQKHWPLSTNTVHNKA